MDEQALITRLETVDVAELVDLLVNASEEDVRSLHLYLGDYCYQRLYSLAIRLQLGSSATKHGNVVVIPGILGSELSSMSVGRQDRIWLNLRQIIDGQFVRLQLDEAGLHELDNRYTVQATGIKKRYYGELLLSLALKWNVHAFWYDWRKDLRLAAAQLLAQINAWFGDKEAVNIVAHSAGGLVARTFVEFYKDRWDSGGKRSRLVMLGTPNHGSYLSVQGITGQMDLVHWIDQVDEHHTSPIRAIVCSFPRALSEFCRLAAQRRANHKITHHYIARGPTAIKISVSDIWTLLRTFTKCSARPSTFIGWSTLRVMLRSPRMVSILPS